MKREFWRKSAGALALSHRASGARALTAAYNFARFHSIFDFGYSHIPNVLRNRGGTGMDYFPCTRFLGTSRKCCSKGSEIFRLFPTSDFYPFGCSIFLASPFLFLLFREGGKFKGACWVAIGLLTFALWCHGNPGGWQFSYRYAMILIPWMFLILAGNGPAKVSAIEVSLFAVSMAINAIATYQFLWTNNIHPSRYQGPDSVDRCARLVISSVDPGRISRRLRGPDYNTHVARLLEWSQIFDFAATSPPTYYFLGHGLFRIIGANNGFPITLSIIQAAINVVALWFFSDTRSDDLDRLLSI